MNLRLGGEHQLACAVGFVGSQTGNMAEGLQRFPTVSVDFLRREKGQGLSCLPPVAEFEEEGHPERGIHFDHRYSKVR